METAMEVADMLRESQRPLFVWGAGMRPYRDKALALARSLGVPVACTWGAIDLINHDDPLAVGGFGTHGTRAANLAVQNADLLVTVGTRLDTKATGTPSDFAPKAKIVMVDIDQAEIDKMPKVGREVIGICADAGEFVKVLHSVLHSFIADADEWYCSGFYEWDKQIHEWKEQYQPQGPAYELMRRISEYTTPEDIIVSDTGNTLGWIMQGFPFKGERFIHAFNFTPMGYGIAGAVGASFAMPCSRVICIVGDGGALMSINELATIARHKLNIKIILLNNMGHGMCRHTQRQWLGGNYYATSIDGGLGFPQWWDLAESFGLPHVYFDDYGDSIGAMLDHRSYPDVDFYHDGKPDMRIVEIDPDATLAFQVKYGEPLA
jgi:acetolactate synthase-1/2/3 large subunit